MNVVTESATLPPQPTHWQAVASKPDMNHPRCGVWTTYVYGYFSVFVLYLQLDLRGLRLLSGSVGRRRMLIYRDVVCRDAASLLRDVCTAYRLKADTFFFLTGLQPQQLQRRQHMLSHARCTSSIRFG